LLSDPQVADTVSGVAPRNERRTQQQRREQAEAALLAAAADLVVEGGVRSLTLARVGERAGYSRGIVTHHFGTKQAMVEALARATQTGFVPGLADMAPGLERLLRLVDGYVAALGGIGRMNRAFLLLWAEVALAVVGQLRGIALQCLLEPGVVDTGSLRRTVREHWRRALAAPA
jgi:AcrR family transcriptional regulator